MAIDSFQFSKIPNITFGPSSIKQIPKIIKLFGNTILLVTGVKSFNTGNRSKEFLDELNRLKISVNRAVIKKEPSPSDIDEIVQNYERKKIDIILSIGGGSVIDAGKALSAMLAIKQPVKDFLEGVGSKVHSGAKIPFIAVPTTSGTGSEATNNAVISKVGQNGFKRSLRHKNFVPDYAIIDPELMLDCPPNITISCGMDAFSQLLESYLSTKSNSMSDSLANEGIRCIRDNLFIAYNDGSSLDARTGMAYAAMLSGITLSNAGLGLIHGFASSIGSVIDIPHGILCGNLLGITNKLMVEKLLKTDKDSETLNKYSTLGKLFLNEKYTNPNDYALHFANYLVSMIDKINFPGLKTYGLTEEKISEIILKTDHKNNPVKFSDKELFYLLKEKL